MMYTMTDLIWLFFIYSFAGWCIEVCYAAIRRRKFINRGFVNSPLCPIYGFGSVLFCIFLSELAGDPFFLFLGGMLLAAVLEYATGMAMEKIFKKKLWDYSDIKWNLNGYVCARYALLWGLLALLTILVTNPLLCGRINLLYCFFWGIAAVVWLKMIYPLLSGLIEKVPPRAGRIGCNCMIVFMIFNMILSSLALARYTERNAGTDSAIASSAEQTSESPANAATSDNTAPNPEAPDTLSDDAVSVSGNAHAMTSLDAFLDSHFPDERMERIYPNAKMVD